MAGSLERRATRQRKKTTSGPMYRPLMVFLSLPGRRSQAVAADPLRAGFFSALGFAAPLEPFD